MTKPERIVLISGIPLPAAKYIIFRGGSTGCGGSLGRGSSRSVSSDAGDGAWVLFSALGTLAMMLSLEVVCRADDER